ncbi:MAG: hypothetical protein KF805_15255 [Phycisphaeraceae bacterium]|nr:hypothetical protein [Phycisphaeraceae bacterium]
MRTGMCSIVLATAMSAGASSFGQCGAVLQYADFNNTEGLTLVGSAESVGGVLRLTRSGEDGAGGAWFTTTQAAVNNGFVTTFRFSITDGTADGFAFVLQGDNEEALGGSGSDMGYGGIPRSVAIEFDTFVFSDEFPGPHVSVQTRGVDENSSEDQFSLAHATLPEWFPYIDSLEVKIEYTPGVLFVYIQDEPVFFCPLDLNSLDDGGPLFGDDGCAWVGFTAGAGAATANQDIESWQFNDWSTSECGPLSPAEFSVPYMPRTGDRVVFHCLVDGPGPRTYQWRRDESDVPEGGRILGALSEVMIIDPFIPADAGGYSFDTGNPCGGFGIGTLDVQAYCPGDINEDGLVDDADFVEFVPSYNALVVPDANKVCDWNGDGLVDDTDFVFFVGYYNNLICE